VVEFLRKALEWQELLVSGQAKNQAEIARREGITRSQVTQVLMLLRLAPEIQERILSMPKSISPPRISERGPRPIARIETPEQPLKAFSDLRRLRSNRERPMQTYRASAHLPSSRTEP
jgi:hypothetical protein